MFDFFLDGDISLVISTEILLEYEEKFQIFWGEEVIQNLPGILPTAENVHRQDIFYFFNLVVGDEDDNKFSDTYLASGADYLVSNDSK